MHTHWVSNQDLKTHKFTQRFIHSSNDTTLAHAVLHFRIKLCLCKNALQNVPDFKQTPKKKKQLPALNICAFEGS